VIARGRIDGEILAEALAEDCRAARCWFLCSGLTRVSAHAARPRAQSSLGCTSEAEIAGRGKGVL